MPEVKTSQILTPEAYLAGEKDNKIKHEYINGEVFAMVGAKDSHVTVSLNLASLLRNHVRAGSCRVYMADMKVSVASANAYFYPDVFVTCEPKDRENEYYKCHPILIAEVLSDSTSAFDRGHKFAMYRQLPSLQEYIIIDPNTLSIDCFRRDSTNHWVLYPFGKNENIEFSSIIFTTPIATLYEDVSFSQVENETGRDPQSID